jgi:hypothetical protein
MKEGRRISCTYLWLIELNKSYFTNCLKGRELWVKVETRIKISDAKIKKVVNDTRK